MVAKSDGMLWKLDRKSFRELQSSSGHEVDLTKVLHKVDVLSSLTTTQLIQLRDVMFPLSFQDGERVITQGEDSKSFFVITKGEASVVQHDGNGGPETEVFIDHVMESE